MQEDRIKVIGEKKSELLQSTQKLQHKKRVAKNAWFQGPDPAVQVSHRPAEDTSANAHASILNRATASKPSRAGRSLLRLQRMYGNRYVQNVLSLSRKAGEKAEATPEVEQEIQAARGGGQPLDSGASTQMESAFGSDLSSVRVHHDKGADELNQSLNSRAFTTGKDIFFRQGEYNPGSSGGRELLAHELTHVMQQSGDGIQTKLKIGQAGDRYEQEADQVARAVIRGEQEFLPQGQDPKGLRRQEQEAQELQMQPLEEEEEELQMQPIEEEEEELQMQPIEEEEEENLE
jgi:hypothetical protein